MALYELQPNEVPCRSVSTSTQHKNETIMHVVFLPAMCVVSIGDRDDRHGVEQWNGRRVGSAR
jgi:hypothetical protein